MSLLTSGARRTLFRRPSYGRQGTDHLESTHNRDVAPARAQDKGMTLGSALRVAMLGTRGVPARYGGFETAVEEVGSRLAKMGHEVTVFCRGGDPDELEYRGMRLVHVPALRYKNAETLSHSMLSIVRKEARRADAAILFNSANAPLLPLLKRFGVPTAVHVDGLEWKRAKWSGTGQKYYKMCEGFAVRNAQELIADAQGIADYYQSEYGTPTRLIAYGAPILDSTFPEKLAQLDLTLRGFHLVVARFEPENHVHLILEGFRKSASRMPLIVVGDAPYSREYVQQLKALAKGDDRIRLVGSLWDQELLDSLYASCLQYLHGHSVGGTNPSLLRAMGAGTAVSAFDVNFNREVLGQHGEFWSGPADVAASCELAETNPDGCRTRGEGLRERARSDYRWDNVAGAYETLIRDLASDRST